MARTGAEDRVIDRSSTLRMMPLFRDAGIKWQERQTVDGVEWHAMGSQRERMDATVVELRGKDHWLVAVKPIKRAPQNMWLGCAAHS